MPARRTIGELDVRLRRDVERTLEAGAVVRALIDPLDPVTRFTAGQSSSARTIVAAVSRTIRDEEVARLDRGCSGVFRRLRVTRS